MWSQAHQDLLARYVARFGLPGFSNDDARAWTKRLAEQFAYTFPTQGWGTKRADPGRPPSTDVICTRIPFLGYDVIIHQGAPEQTLASFPHADDLTGQVYIGVVPENHVGPGVPAPPVCPPTFPYPDEGTAVQLFQNRVKQAYLEVGRSFPDPHDSDAYRHFVRYGFSCHDMPEPQANDKHIKELRKALGL